MNLPWKSFNTKIAFLLCIALQDTQKMSLAIIDLFSAPFAYDFMRHAFVAGTLAALLSSLVGFFVVVRQLGFAAHALGHVGFAGACGAILLGWTPLVGQLIITVVAGIAMGGLGKRL